MVSSLPGFEKFKNKLKAEPLVPIGCITTATVLGLGLVQLRRGNVKASQQLMRARVVAQLATVGVMAYGAYIASADRKEFDDTAYKGNLGIAVPAAAQSSETSSE